MSSPIIKEEARDPKQTRAMPQIGGSGERKPRPQLPEALKCPRCDSNNTKFCYYNNYSMSQPRYFCKACRRYWTHGGTLRNVPIGGGCRKNKHASRFVLGSHTSSSSSATYAPLSPSTNASSSNMSINKHMMMVPNMTMPTPTTMGLFPNVLPTLMPTGGGGGFDFTMDNQHRSLSFTPMSLPSQGPVPMLAAGGSEATPSFLEMLRGGIFHGSSSYNTSLTMSGGNNGMDMPFSLPSYGAMHRHGLNGSTTNDDRQLVGPQQDNKAIVKSINNNNGGSLLGLYWTKLNNNNKGQ